ncbi:Alcohol acetyltransferase [Didymella pomorum]|uniref:Alcohol acetyltransferase n=1 Tax=Didymella pomorum TaxID=749634 RepID=A0A9W8YUP0_9PLEO|nr:Alcohol acetyltransferase [Didymella pomorum]
MLPPIENLHLMGLSWRFLLQALWHEYAPALFKRKTDDAWTGSRVFSSEQPIPKCCFRTFVLSRQTTQKLVQCLFAASLFANPTIANYDKVKIAGPMSMRRFLHIPKDQMTNAVTQYHYTHLRSAFESRRKTAEGTEATGMGYFSWEEAREVKSAIEAEVAKGGRDNPASLLKYVPNLHDFFTSKLGKPRSSTAELSNIGVYKQSNADDVKEIATDAARRWEIGKMTFSQCPNLTGSAFGINIVTGGDGNMSVNLCWGEDAVTEEMMTALAEDVERSVLVLTT